MSLKIKTLKGIIWTLLDTVFVKGLFFASGIVLAKLLGPEEFGLVGMISIFIAIGQTIVDSGMSASLIRSKDIDEKDLATVFYLNLLISVLLFLIFFAIAPLIADFFMQETLVWLVRVYCITFLITATYSVQLALLNREMRFRKITLLNIPGTIAGVVVGIVMAYHNYGVWSIIGMHLIMQTLLSILLWSTSSWKPSFLFSQEHMKTHLNFGYKLSISGIIDVAFKNSYNVIIGKLYPLDILGKYERARKFAEYPGGLLTGIILKVTYPLLSKIQDEPQKIKKVYQDILESTFFLSSFLFISIAVIAKPLFLFVLGEEWIEAATFFQIFCFAFMLYPIQVFNLNLLKVFGRSDLFLKLEIIKKCVMVITIITAVQFGVFWLACSVVLNSFIALFINTYYSGELINYNTREQLLSLLPFFLFSCISAFVMVASGSYITFENVIYNLFIQLCIGALVYLVLNIIFRTAPIKFIYNNLRSFKS
jgi:O-antigen/teichoic acid export membrane protein